MRRKRYLYHVTDPGNVPSIMIGGLKRGGGIRSCCAVYLSENPLSWYQDGKTILRVDISGLKEINATTFLPDSDEVLFWGDIPAWKQTKDGLALRITEVTDHFRDVTKKKNGKRNPRKDSGRRRSGMIVTDHDKCEKTCFTCSNAFVDEDQYHDTYLCCVLQDGKNVEDNESCNNWN